MKRNNIKIAASQRFRFSISKSYFKSQLIGAKAFVKRGQRMLKPFNQMVYAIGGRLTPNWVRLNVVYLKKVNLLHKHGGTPMVVKYLKVCSVLMQQVCAGYKITDLTPLGCRISRSKSGLPRIIPAYQRKLIMRGITLNQKFWLTLFSMYRDLHFTGELKLSTITGISKASTDVYEIKKYIKYFTNLFWKENDLLHNFRTSGIFQILTSGPQVKNTDNYGMKTGNFDFIKLEKTGEFNSYIHPVLRCIKIFMHPKKENLLKAFFSIAKLTNNEELIELWNNLSSRIGYEEWARTHPRYYYIKKNLDGYLGKLSYKEEAAGKVRIFAMVDPWTQWALRPLHRNLFRVLSRIKMDGTFNQYGPLKRVPFGKVPIYSFDLSAATDRLPIWLQQDILSEVFGSEFAESWKTLLVDREYQVSPRPMGMKFLVPKGTPKQVRYAVGQPMGALSSWAMLAITHHYIVQYCAWISGVTPPGEMFSEYAVLGDDIIIWNKPVADKYLNILKRLGVDVGLAKSIISLKGKGLEFAKRTILNGVDVSPIPFKEQSSAHRSTALAIQFMRQHKLTPLELLRFLGYGYKVDPSKKSKVVEVLSLALTIPDSAKSLMEIFNQDSPYIDLNMVSYPRHEVKKALVTLVMREISDLRKKSAELMYTLAGYSAGAYISATGPWKTSKGILAYAICENYAPRYIKELSQIKDTASFLRHDLKPLYEMVISPYWDIPGTHEQYLPSTRLLIPAMNFIFEAQKQLDEIQVDLLMNPLRSLHESSISYKEEKRTLRMWDKWRSLLSRVNYVQSNFNKF